MKLKLILLGFMIACSPAHAGTVSFDQLAVSSDLTVSKYNADLNTIYTEFNSNTESSNIADDTLLEADMADEINPRVRTAEGASCEFVFNGLLTTTTSGTLTGSVPTGTAYPRGFRCEKTSSTPKTFTGTMWTYTDIDQNCDFQFTEVAIDAGAPAIASNSIRLSRVSTDATEITSVQDLRTTNCTAGPFNDISDASSQASLGDLLRVGQYGKRFSLAGRTPEGWAQGLNVSFDTHTTFAVTTGGAFINGLYRVASAEVTVPQTADNPSLGTSGIDTGAIASSTLYYVYAVADQDDVSTLSISYSTNSSAPTGVTNARLIGTIKTDATDLFTSRDATTAHAITEKEIPGGWAQFNTGGSVLLNNSYNVSAVAYTGTGDYVVTWDYDFASADYVVVGMGEKGAGNEPFMYIKNGTKARGSVSVRAADVNASAIDPITTHVLAFGDTRR